MRPWIAHLVSNTHALNDFQSYVSEVVLGLSKRLTSLVHDSKMEEARSVAYEIRVYEGLKKDVNRELREQHSQTDYINETKGEL